MWHGTREGKPRSLDAVSPSFHKGDYFFTVGNFTHYNSLCTDPSQVGSQEESHVRLHRCRTENANNFSDCLTTIIGLQVRVLNIFRREMFTLFFAISHGVRPISRGRSAHSARGAPLSSRSGKLLGVLFRKRSIFVQVKSYGWPEFVSRLCPVGAPCLLNAALGCQISQATVCPSCPASCAVVVKVVVSVCVGVGAEPGP